MGDPSYRHNDPEWDVEYERMKKLPFKTFEKLCGAGFFMYIKSNDSAWDKEYEQMKFLDIPSFKKLCKVMVNYWAKSQKAGTN